MTGNLGRKGTCRCPTYPWASGSTGAGGANSTAEGGRKRGLLCLPVLPSALRWPLARASRLGLPSSRELAGPHHEISHGAVAEPPARDAVAQRLLAVLWRPLIGPKYARPTLLEWPIGGGVGVPVGRTAAAAARGPSPCSALSPRCRRDRHRRCRGHPCRARPQGVPRTVRLFPPWFCPIHPGHLPAETPS